MNHLILLAVGIAFLSTGCSMFGKKKEPEKQELTINGEKPVRYSEVNQMPALSNRQYKRMNRSKMEEEAELNAQAGSMWVMEGQGAYLFTQNKSRREGDLLNVKIEGAAQKQIETKVTVIKKLLQQLEEEERKAKEAELAAQQQKLAADQKPADGAARAPAAVAPKPEEKKEAAKEEPINIESVPTRITERMADGNYRLKGQQPFMIGKREYKVIVTGIIRPEDFNDEGMSSNKLLDPQFDVVSLRKKEL